MIVAVVLIRDAVKLMDAGLVDEMEIVSVRAGWFRVELVGAMNDEAWKTSPSWRMETVLGQDERTYRLERAANGLTTVTALA